MEPLEEGCFTAGAYLPVSGGILTLQGEDLDG